MKTNNTQFRFIHSVIKLSVILTITTLMGCTQPAKHTSSAVSNTVIKHEVQPITEPKPVIRYGRYTLVEVGATSDQQDLLNQIIDITIPTPPQKQNITVADAMHYVLLNSGYRLCESEQISAFNYFQLPLAHRHLGPITLKEALMVLAGESWQMQVDQQNRLICFSNHAQIITQGV